jgi:hypothetical protein
MRSGFDPKTALLRNIPLPTRVVRGERTSPALRKCADILSRALANASMCHKRTSSLAAIFAFFSSLFGSEGQNKPRV